MYDCSSCLDGWQPGNRASSVSQGFNQTLSLLPLLLFPPSRTLLNATTKEKNATHGLPWGGLVILHLALAGRGVLRTTRILSPKAQYFITVWTWSCHVNPNPYSCFWAIHWRLLWLDHFLSCILFPTFYMFKGVRKWNLSKFLDVLAMNLQKEITLKKHI